MCVYISNLLMDGAVLVTLLQEVLWFAWCVSLEHSDVAFPCCFIAIKTFMLRPALLIIMKTVN
jgi:hypothetical protein